MDKIRVILAEDHTIVRKGIRMLLEKEPDIEVVGEAATGRDAVRLVEGLLPDIAILDNTMPLLNGLEATRQIKKQFPDVKVLILTMHTDEEYVHQFLQEGASGYIVKQAAPEELVSAVRAVQLDYSYLSPTVSRTVIDEYLRQSDPESQDENFDRLTAREREVLQLIAEGFQSKQIANELEISCKTVGVHRLNIMSKLNAHTVSELVRYAIRKRMVSIE